MNFFRHGGNPAQASTQKPIGLGLKLGSDLKVREIVPRGPCDGVMLVGDMITHIDGTSVKGKKPQDIIHLTTGTEGSEVSLTIERVLPLKDIIHQQIALGKKKRDSAEIKKTFDQYCNGGTHITKDNMMQALKDFDVAKDILPGDEERVNHIFESLDRNNDGVLDLKEFTIAVQAPTMLEQLMRTLPLSLYTLLAECIPNRVGEDPLRATSRLAQEDIDIIAQVFKEQLKEMLWDYVSELRSKIDAVKPEQDISAGRKFEQDGPKMMCGKIDDFHKGLAGRVGVPSLDFEPAMALEHANKDGHDFEFTTPNYNITTCPADEWAYVMGHKPCPTDQMGNDRKMPSIDELLKKDITKQCKLIQAEVIALFLYSGPMFHIYNAVLRQWPKKVFDPYKGADKLFPCTIFALSSALQKLSQVTTLEPGMKLFRGLNNKVNLPDYFFKCDRYCCTGFSEWGFMSTTLKMEVALMYAGIGKDHDGKTTPRVLEIQVGSVDRGACVKEFSQYPHEEEYMYVPCSFVEKAGDISVIFDKENLVELVPVKVNSNLKTKTLEEIVQEKKDLHNAAFRHLLHRLESELKAMATDQKAKARLSQDKSAWDGLTVDAFIARIMEQCKEVLSRHESVSCQEYVKHGSFRKLLLEMVETKANARAKLEEWLENPRSFIRYRWNLSLVKVRRRWYSYLSQERARARSTGRDLEKPSKRLCKEMGLIVESVTETNELGETPLMWSAAEGRSDFLLRLLVDAGAIVNHSRADGVTPLWLAAENGHVECIKMLHELKAEVNLPANDHTTPLCIAARNGKRRCVELLIDLGADVNHSGHRGLRPVHEAALCGSLRTVDTLVTKKADINARDRSEFTPYQLAFAAGNRELAEFIVKNLKGEESQVPTHTDVFDGKRRRLIVSTGDISDIDGFMALAEYAKLHADVIFVMNYPAYIGVNDDEVDKDFANVNPGLGYKYTAQEVLESVKADDSEQYRAYKALMERYVKVDNNERMKCAMTDVAFAIAHGVWNEVPNHGELLFYIGGINAVNPFSSTRIKNEVLVYAEHLEVKTNLQPKQGVIYGEDGQRTDVQWKRYSEVYMDFNGSLAFWNDYLASKLSEEEIVSKIKGVFVMGGVYADKVPVTTPSLPDVLNRFSSATMNQLYHPQNSANFLAFLTQFNIPTYIVTNNVVQDLTTFSDADKKIKTFDGVENFMKNNGLDGLVLRKLAQAHYESRYNPPRKAFDYYTAFALKTLFTTANSFPCPPTNAVHSMGSSSQMKQKYLFISNAYGITFVSPHHTWEETRAAYAKAVDTEIGKSDCDFTKTKKFYFAREIEKMMSINHLASMPVVDLDFELDDTTKVLTVRFPFADSQTLSVDQCQQARQQEGEDTPSINACGSDGSNRESDRRIESVCGDSEASKPSCE